MYKGFLLAVVLVISLVLAACGPQEPEQGETPAAQDTEEQGGEQTAMEETTGETTAMGTTGATAGGTTGMTGMGTTAETTGVTAGGMTSMQTTAGTAATAPATGQAAGGGQPTGGGVAVGGFVVDTPGVPESTVPQVTVSRQAARQYLNQVQPIVEGSVRDVSDLVQPSASVENGNLSLSVETSSLQDARSDVQSGLEQLQNVQPPQELQPVNQQLIEAYESTLPAYDGIIQAAESGDPQQVSSAVDENLPRIERFNAETRAIVQDLQQAARAQQG